MCEQCRIGRVSGEPLPDDDEPVPCEYMPNPEGDEEKCPREAQFVVHDYYVERHLCEEHMRELSGHLEEGLGDILRQAGFQKAGDFAPIKEPAKCDYVGPEQMIDGREVKFCGKPAAYAQLVLEEMFLCAEHARMEGYNPELTQGG